jgi:alpha-galactosidase
VLHETKKAGNLFAHSHGSAGATESAVLRQAEYLVSSGLAVAGYETVNIDDGWMASARTSDGSLTWNTARFPDGIPWLAR